MQYSPKLKKAMEEIKAIINRYDIAAVVVLHTPGFTEYLYRIDPSYSAAYIDMNDPRAEARQKIKIKLEHYNQDCALRQRFVSDTYNLFDTMSMTTGMLYLNLEAGHKSMQTVVEDISKDPGSFTGHDEQNN